MIDLLIAGAARLMTTIMRTIFGVVRANWWMAMILYVMLGLANAYLVFLKPRQLSQG